MGTAVKLDSYPQFGRYLKLKKPCILDVANAANDFYIEGQGCSVQKRDTMFFIIFKLGELPPEERESRAAAVIEVMKLLNTPYKS